MRMDGGGRRREGFRGRMNDRRVPNTVRGVGVTTGLVTGARKPGARMQDHGKWPKPGGRMQCTVRGANPPPTIIIYYSRINAMVKTTFNWSILFYIGTGLVVVASGILVWYFIIRDNEEEVTKLTDAAGEFDGTLDTSNLYRFLEKQYVVDRNLSVFNACSTDNNQVQCEDDACTNCICPDKCREIGTKYMIMDKLSGSDKKYRCMCFNRLRDVIEETSNLSRDDELIQTPPEEEGTDWEMMNKWHFRLLPPPGGVRLAYGSGGTYEPTTPLFPFDAKHKVYATYVDTPQAAIGAVYMLDSEYDDDAMTNRFVDEFSP